MRVIDRNAINQLKDDLKNLQDYNRVELVTLALSAAVFIINVRDFSLANDDKIKEVSTGVLPEIVIKVALDILNTYPKEEIYATLEALLKEAVLTQQHQLDRFNA